MTPLALLLLLGGQLCVGERMSDEADITSVEVREHHFEQHGTQDDANRTEVAPDYAWDVLRFLQAQNDPMSISDAMIATQNYDTALAQLQASAKLGHWVWYIFPTADFHMAVGQPKVRRELGTPTNKFFSLRSSAEVKAYLDNADLRARLIECWEAVLAARGTALGLGTIGTLMDGARIGWFHDNDPVFKKLSGAELFASVSNEGRSKAFVGDRGKFYGHLLLFVSHAQAFFTAEKDAGKKAIYKTVLDTVSAVKAIADGENLDPAGVVAASAPDEETWKVNPTAAEYTAILQIRKGAIDEMNSGDEGKLAVPPAGWVFLPGGADGVKAGYQAGPYSCKAWCTQLTAKLR